jgi:hypothetical protein
VPEADDEAVSEEGTPTDLTALAHVRRAFEGFYATGEPVWELTHEHVVVADRDIMDAGGTGGTQASRAGSTIGPPLGLSSPLSLLTRSSTPGGKIVRIDYSNDRSQALKSGYLEE